MSHTPIHAGIVGFRGYSGAELLQILTRHPHTTPVLMEHRADSEDRSRPRSYRGPARIACSGDAARELGINIIFLATPPEVSMELAPVMLDAGAKVIDLSGAFRLRTADTFKKWYKEEHTQPSLLAEAVYGLPEFYRDEVKGARLIANPGCYPTAANIALEPLVAAGVIAPDTDIVCDAKSGVSGAGRKPTLKTHFCEVTENFSAYSLLDHRHVPEVLMNSKVAAERFSFTAQLLPIHRGILETIYFRVQKETNSSDLIDIYEKRYAGEPFIRIYHANHVPDLAAVNHTNFCDLGVKVDAGTGRALVVSAIDNLVKGAAGQAVQNMNLMFGYPEAEGLL